MVEDIIQPRYKKFLACPCCGKPMRIQIRYARRYASVKIEPIHAYECSICKKEFETKIEIHHEEYDDDNPTAHTIIVCESCHLKLDGHNRQRNTRNEIAKVLESMGLLGDD